MNYVKIGDINKRINICLFTASAAELNNCYWLTWPPVLVVRTWEHREREPENLTKHARHHKLSYSYRVEFTYANSYAASVCWRKTSRAVCMRRTEFMLDGLDNHSDRRCSFPSIAQRAEMWAARDLVATPQSLKKVKTDTNSNSMDATTAATLTRSEGRIFPSQPFRRARKATACSSSQKRKVSTDNESFLSCSLPAREGEEKRAWWWREESERVSAHSRCKLE